MTTPATMTAATGTVRVPATPVTSDGTDLSSPDWRESGPPAGAVDGFVAAVEDRLRALLDGERCRWQARYPALSLGFDALEEFVLGGGKRLRPRFAYWGFTGAGGDPSEPRLCELGAAIELFHAFALIHDDVMDGSDVRRHRPTVHRRFGGHHDEMAWRGEERRVAEGFAILLGDLAFAYSTALLTGVPFAVAQLFDTMRIELHVGQYLDLHCAAEERAPVHVLDDVARYKTATYSVQRPLHLGAALAGGPADLETCYSRYGLAVGEAFQHRDDLLGVFGDPAVTGKPAGDDLRSGKSTLLLRGARASAGAEASTALARVGCDDLDDAAIDDIRTFMVSCGAVAAVERRIELLIAQAHAALADIPLAGAAPEGLRRLAAEAAWRVQ